MSYATRFAPSPTGPLHLGHAYSAMLAHDRARAKGGRFLLRIEDIDRQRSKPQWEQQIYDDLTWLGLTWETPVMRQSDRLDRYLSALQALWGRDLLFPCTCTRRDIEAAASAPHEGEPRMGPDGVIYPGTCRAKAVSGALPMPDGVALRLSMSMATGLLRDDDPLTFAETGRAPLFEDERIAFTHEDLERNVGDIVLSRKDFLGSYHLSVVLDDADQGVTEVVRGADLFEATKVHLLLQHLFGLKTPTYHHHDLIRDDQGRRLAKRDDARSIAAYRADGATPQDIRRMVGMA